MSQYITVSSPADDCYALNDALKQIISFVGKKYRESKEKKYRESKKKKFWLKDDNFVIGLSYINKECRYWHKNTIRNLLNSEKITCNESEYRKWKFHKRKTVKFLDKLHRVLKDFDANEEIMKLFDDLYKAYSNTIYIEKEGGYVIAYPYRSSLDRVLIGNFKFISPDIKYSEEDKKCIKNIRRSFEAFNSFYS